MIDGFRRMIFIGVVGVLGVFMTLATYFFDFREPYKEVGNDDEHSYGE